MQFMKVTMEILDGPGVYVHIYKFDRTWEKNKERKDMISAFWSFDFDGCFLFPASLVNIFLMTVVLYLEYFFASNYFLTLYYNRNAFFIFSNLT